MAKIQVQTDCENSPKAMLLRDFTIAFAQGNESLIIDSISEDISWEMVGNEAIRGKTAVTPMVKDMLDGSIEELTITNVITHGNAGSVNGTMKFSDGQTFGFCDVYSFTSHSKDAKIKSITSYAIAMK